MILVREPLYESMIMSPHASMSYAPARSWVWAIDRYSAAVAESKFRNVTEDAATRTSTLWQGLDIATPVKTRCVFPESDISMSTALSFETGFPRQSPDTATTVSAASIQASGLSSRQASCLARALVQTVLTGSESSLISLQSGTNISNSTPMSFNMRCRRADAVAAMKAGLITPPFCSAVRRRMPPAAR